MGVSNRGREASAHPFEHWLHQCIRLSLDLEANGPFVVEPSSVHIFVVAVKMLHGGARLMVAPQSVLLLINLQRLRAQHVMSQPHR
jgi:hypothetical protein